MADAGATPSPSSAATLRPSERPQAQGLPPHDVDAEEAVIASILLDEEAWTRIISILRTEDFFLDRTRWCFAACNALADRGEPLNRVTVAHELERMDRLSTTGGDAFLDELIGSHFTAVGVETHAGVIARTSVYRQLINAAGRMGQVAYAGGPDTSAALAHAEGLLLAIRSADSQADFQELRTLLDNFLEDPGEAVEGSLVDGVPTGFMDLDALLGGLKRGDLTVVAARTGVGKSSLLLNFARNAAVNQRGTVAFFALEMSGAQLAMRLLSAEADVDATRLRLGTHNVDEETKVMHAIGALSDAEIYIDDSATLSVPEIRARCRRLQAERGLDLVLVDYLQLLGAASIGSGNRAIELGQITRGLKETARELDVPIVTAAQLSRAVEQRTPHIPMLSDLRESGSIEQDSDVVMFIYREDVYRSAEEWQDLHPDEAGGAHPRGIAQIIVAKHRNGPTGAVAVRFSDRTASFHDLILRSPPVPGD